MLRHECCGNTAARADLGVSTVTSPPPLARQPISCYYYACDLSYFDVVLCPSSSQISPDPLNALSLRSLGFSKSPPLKNPRSANAREYRGDGSDDCGSTGVYTTLYRRCRPRVCWCGCCTLLRCAATSSCRCTTPRCECRRPQSTTTSTANCSSTSAAASTTTGPPAA